MPKLKRWLDADSTTIVTLHLESSTGTTGNQVLTGLLKSAGLSDFVYLKHFSDPWPRLGEMRASNKRLVVFSDNGYDGFFHTTAYRETEYDLGDFQKCEMRLDDRNTNKTSTLLVMNHFHMTSHETAKCSYNEINDPHFIKTRSDECYKQEGIHPTFIVCDRIEQGGRGGCREAVLTLNALRLKAACFSTPANLSDTSQTDAKMPKFEADTSFAEGLALAVPAATCLLIWPQQRLRNPPLLPLSRCLKLAIAPLGWYSFHLVPKALQVIAPQLESPALETVAFLQHHGNWMAPSLEAVSYIWTGWHSSQSKKHAIASLLLGASSTSFLINDLVSRYVSSGWIPSLSIAAFVPLFAFLNNMPGWIHRAFQT